MVTGCGIAKPALLGAARREVWFETRLKLTARQPVWSDDDI
jgi:hypothetical protein